MDPEQELRERILENESRVILQNENIDIRKREITQLKNSIAGNPDLKKLYEKSAKKEIAKLSESPFKIDNIISNYVYRDHNKYIRFMERCGLNNFMTCHDDGLICLWETQHQTATVRCVCKRESSKPMEAFVWNHQAGYGIGTYDNKNEGHQVALITIQDGNQEIGFSTLDVDPHSRGEVRCATFLSNDVFLTGGEDHKVIKWERAANQTWSATTLKGDTHTSRVTGLATINSSTAISIGYDKRVYVHDLTAEKNKMKFTLDNPGVHITRNPELENVFLISTGAKGNGGMISPLSLHDIRCKKEAKQLHCWGWSHEGKGGLSSFMMQEWAPNGWVFSSGSEDTCIRLFDIRYGGREPFYTLQAHTTPVRKAIFHPKRPELVTFSSDLYIGYHNLRCSSVYSYFLDD